MKIPLDREILFIDPVVFFIFLNPYGVILEPKDKYLDYAQVNKDKFIEMIIKGKSPDDEKDAVFMARSPGAGKTEVALGLEAGTEVFNSEK